MMCGHAFTKILLGLCAFSLIRCALPPAPERSPDDFALQISTPEHLDSVYYLGDSIRFFFRITSIDSASSLTVIAESIFDTVITPVRNDSFFISSRLTGTGTKKITITAVLKNGLKQDTTFRITVKGYAPVIIAQSDSIVQRVMGSSCSLFVQAQGTPPLHWQWYRNDTLLAGDTLPYKTFMPAQLRSSGTYFCVVQNGWDPPDTSYEFLFAVTDTTKPVVTLLSTLYIQGGNGTLSPLFRSRDTVYEYSAHFRATTIIATAVPMDLEATMKMNGKPISPGQPFQMELDADTSEILLVVTGYDGEAQRNYRITILRTNNAPRFTVSIDNPKDSAFAGKLLIDTLRAVDSDSDPLQFTLIPGHFPVGMVVDSSAGIILWTPDTINKQFPVWVSACDGRDSDTLKWQIRVLPNSWVCPEQPTQIDGMVLIRAKDYCFMMGSDRGEKDEIPVHYVCFTYDFWMSRSEITQRDYVAIMGSNPSHFVADDLPVNKILWQDAVRYCIKKSQLAGLENCYDSLNNWSCNVSRNGYRLPTEAEWEYACRGGTTTEYFTGDTVQANSAVYGTSSPSNVPAANPNPYSLYDMMGNVREWCNDRHDITYYANSPHFDPPGSNSDQYYYRVARGGAYNSEAYDLRSAKRHGHGINSTYPHVGFRIVRSVR